MNIGDRVRFKKEYHGYFDNLKDKTFTIENIYKKDDSIDTDCVTLKEIAEAHLISIRHLEKR
jgi:hypothetical protein